MTDNAAFNVELEQQILGAVLCHNDLLMQHPVDMAWFYDPVHMRIMERITARIGEGNIASPVTLRAELAGDPGLQQLGGPAYLVRMAGASIGNYAFGDYVRELRNLWARRTLIDALRSGADQLNSFVQGDNPSATIGKIETEIALVATVASSKPLVKSWLKASTDAIGQIGQAYQRGYAGTPTGLTALDDFTGGFSPGDMVVLAGRPSMGKTAIALELAWRIAEAGRPVMFASLEMSPEQLMVRWYSRTLRKRGIVDVPYSDIRSGRLSEQAFRHLVGLAKEVQDMPMFYGERECRSLPRLRAAAKRATQAAGQPLGMIVVDYLQLIEGLPGQNDYSRVSAASTAMKSLAMDMGCPVLALSQLSRGVESREPPVPRLSDLRDSGKVEEDADTIMLCYREAYYLSKTLDELPRDDFQSRAEVMTALDRCRFDVDLLVPKMRGGETGKVSLKYWPAFNLIDSPPASQARLPYPED